MRRGNFRIESQLRMANGQKHSGYRSVSISSRRSRFYIQRMDRPTVVVVVCFESEARLCKLTLYDGRAADVAD